MDSEIPPIELVAVVSDFPEVFPDNLSGIPPLWEIYFGINFLPEINPISIHPYQMALTELKMLKAKLKDLLDKGFRRPSISPWGAPLLFVKLRMGLLECVLTTANSTRSPLSKNTLSLGLMTY